jgi:hypothetical protein
MDKPRVDIIANLLEKKNLGIPLMPTISCFPKFWHTHLFQIYKEKKKNMNAKTFSNAINKLGTSACFAMYYPNFN